MSVISIVEPLPIVSVLSASGGWINPMRLATPDPKEAATYPSGGTDYMRVDLGADMPLDTIFLGYTNDTGIGTLRLQANKDDGTELLNVPVNPCSADGVTPRHFLYTFAAPISARYIYIRADTAYPSNYAIGTFAAGLSFRPSQGGVEFGAGRPLEDTGTAERLFGGGFGIDEGVVAGGYQFTLSYLTAAEKDALYALVRRRKTTRSILVIEDPDYTTGLNERIHWSLFRKLNTYERTDPTRWKWDFIVGDWA